jgi:hypothetical protein
MTTSMGARHLRSADRARRRIHDGTHDRAAFRAALLAVPFDGRDAWLDHVLGLDALPDDGPELPVGCVPYLPCAVDALIEIVDRAEIGPSDVFVDIGSGVGRAMALVHLLSGAAAIGIEIQSELVHAAREVARTVSPRISSVHGDALDLTDTLAAGSVYFFYCPFGGDRLRTVLDALGTIARTRPIRVCCVDLPLPGYDWLAPEPAASGSVAIYRSAS